MSALSRLLFFEGMLEGLSPRFQFFSFVHVSSTMDIGAQLLREMALKPPILLYAKSQSHGRGKYGRPWYAAEQSLMVTLIVHPHKPLTEISQLAVVAGVAAHDALKSLLKKPLMLKWPNDLLIDNKKVGGILIETHQAAQKQRWAVIGVGLNFKNVPKHLEYQATDLNSYILSSISQERIFVKISNTFLTWYDHWQCKGYASVEEYWSNHLVHLAKRTI